jgi:hypothetical protein
MTNFKLLPCDTILIPDFGWYYVWLLFDYCCLLVAVKLQYITASLLNTPATPSYTHRTLPYHKASSFLFLLSNQTTSLSSHFLITIIFLSVFHFTINHLLTIFTVSFFFFPLVFSHSLLFNSFWYYFLE